MRTWFSRNLAPNGPALKELLLLRLIQPFFRLKAQLYFWLAIVGGGGAGLWLTYLLYINKQASSRDLVLSIFTFVIALAFVAMMDATMDEKTDGTMRLFLILFMALALWPPGEFIYQLLKGDLPPAISFKQTFLSCIPGMLVWWLANASDPKFAATTKPANAVGGDPMQEI